MTGIHGQNVQWGNIYSEVSILSSSSSFLLLVLGLAILLVLGSANPHPHYCYVQQFSHYTNSDFSEVYFFNFYMFIECIFHIINFFN